MLWIEYRSHDKHIPQELYYEGYKTDKDHYGRTPLMIWLDCRQDKRIPKELYYNDCCID